MILNVRMIEWGDGNGYRHDRTYMWRHRLPSNIAHDMAAIAATVAKLTAAAEKLGMIKP